jgi:serine/threonine protein kinase
VTLSNALAPGSHIDRYRIIRRLAVGGMAEIYLACATGIEGFEKRVVLKRILPQFACRSEFVGMFLDEARLAATLHHPNIAQVYDIGADSETYYFTMEYVEGRDLRHIRKRAVSLEQDIPLDTTVAVTLGVAAGLHAAHEKRGPDGAPLGIVHRDVSAANVIVTFDGNVKLIDFGIAKAARRQTNTRTGILKGKSCSMSPEQCLAEPVDRRSDIFSLGILLYEASTGTRAFPGDTEFETMRMIVEGILDPPSERRPEYPAQLERIVMRALERDPDDRYQTAQELFIDLDCFAREERLAVSPYNLADYVGKLFPKSEEPDEGASPPLFLLGDDAELPAELRARSASDEARDTLESIDVDLSDPEIPIDEEPLERAATVDFEVHRAVSPALEAAARADTGDSPSRRRRRRRRSSDLETQEEGSAPRAAETVDLHRAATASLDERAATESPDERAATASLEDHTEERRLPSDVKTSIVRKETRAESAPLFRSRISIMALTGSLALAAAVLIFGLFADDGWFAAAGETPEAAASMTSENVAPAEPAAAGADVEAAGETPSAEVVVPVGVAAGDDEAADDSSASGDDDASDDDASDSDAADDGDSAASADESDRTTRRARSRAPVRAESRSPARSKRELDRSDDTGSAPARDAAPAGASAKEKPATTREAASADSGGGSAPAARPAPRKAAPAPVTSGVPRTPKLLSE